MSELRSFPFGSVPIYNPQSLSKGEALAQFHARKSAYESLIALLREDRPSHVLIIGTRGMGKTTLLQRVRYGVEDDAVLNSRYLALVFPEEQYNVNRLHHFLLNTVDALADALEKMDKQQLLSRVEAYAEKVGKFSQEEVEEQVPQFLAEIGQELGKAFLLLVDNADRLFETIHNQEQWRLRELLSHRRDLTLFGATTQASEGIYGHDRAFFEFFQIHRLTPLTLAQVRDLLLHLSESVEGEGSAKQKVEKWLASDPTRLRTLVQLTGGNPRTTVLLFHLVLDGLTGGAREYLEQLLDQCTPNYKGRVDELPPQAQQVLDAVALRWDPATAMEVADDTGLETSIVSTQLTRLVRQGHLEKADPGDSKKALYQIAERFFNIWYLMRASRRVRTKLRWFGEFLRVFFDSTELERMAWERLERFRDAGRTRSTEIETAFTYVLASVADRSRFEDYLQKECANKESEWRPYIDSLRHTYEEIANTCNVSLVAKNETESIAKVRVVQKVDIEVAEKALKSEPENAVNWVLLGDALARGKGYTEASEAAYRKAVSLESEWPVPWHRLGNLLTYMERRDEAEAAYCKAIDLDSEWSAPWYRLGNLLRLIPNRSGEAEAAYRKAIELNPNSPVPWYGLGDFLKRTPNRREEAEAAYRRVIELDPNLPWIWSDLGQLLAGTPAHREEAEAAYRRAIDLDPQWPFSWQGLGSLLTQIPERHREAEIAYRRAIDLDPSLTGAWVGLGMVLSEITGRMDEAEKAFRESVRIEPDSGLLWVVLGVFLAWRVNKPNEGIIALRKAIELEPQNHRAILSLGILLYSESLDEQGASHLLRRAYQIQPSDSVSAAILAACVNESEISIDQSTTLAINYRQAGFWNELFGMCHTYAPFAKILIRICDLVQKQDNSNTWVPLCRAVALAQLHDFPRAFVALEDALIDDPITQLATGIAALTTFFAAAVRSGRVRECIELLDKKEWKDAWRPIYEALMAVEAGSSGYLKRVAVEIREPALVFLRRIAPELPEFSVQSYA